MLCNGNKIKICVEFDMPRGNEYIFVPLDRLLNSNFFRDLINFCIDGVSNSNGVSNINSVNHSIPYPKQFNDVVDSYVYYLTHNNIEPTTVGRCLQLCHYLDDSIYLNTIVTMLINQYINNLSCLHTMLNDLIPNLQQDIYLLCPFHFIPQNHVLNTTFLNKWLSLDKHKTLIINSCHYGIHCERYSNDNIKCIIPIMCYDQSYETTILHLTHPTNLIHDTAYSWCESGNILSNLSYHNDKLHGDCYVWYPDSQQLKEHSCYRDGIKHGNYTQWTPDGNQQHNFVYHNGIKQNAIKHSDS